MSTHESALLKEGLEAGWVYQIIKSGFTAQVFQVFLVYELWGELIPLAI